ncbi:hypothetical protein QBC37DRAFT_434022 [Rhypophila decipiens]|uniref:RRM domain-containing protein n=1 Tax=Rhypophila decipiens TaxID=261697 RepID=A0AAN6XZ10_9PEZI|nr:hypothetical protein QBC37DRAFT_434022 [Rhypophila decipiens]
MDSPRSSDAAAEGRRLYMGNLLYSVKPGDVEQVLEQTGYQYDKIHISVDPISGRNPGYCFVEFLTKDEADRALTELQGMTVFDRPVKLGPCHPKSNTRTTGADSPRREARSGNAGTWGSSSPSTNKPTFQRWGDWNGERSDRSPAPASQTEQGPYGAIKHLSEMKNGEMGDGKRLYVGGLGKMIDQETNDVEMREIFAEFDVVAIGKRITPHPATRLKPGNHHYCFIDFSSEEEAQRAAAATNGLPVPGGFLRVNVARGKTPARGDNENGDGPSSNTDSPRRYDENRRPRFNDRQRSDGDETPTKGANRQEDREEREARQKAIMERGTWRRGN